MGIEDHEKEFDPKAQFEATFLGLVTQWQQLGIDSDDFIRCALCHELFFDPDNGFEPLEHCRNTVYVIRTANDLFHARVLPSQGGFVAARDEARRIKGRLFGVDADGKEIRLVFYDKM